MNLRRSVPALFLALGAAAACASSPDGMARDMAGCYYFVQDETARQLNLPWGVRLTADSLTDAPHLDQADTYVAVTLRGPDQTTDFPFGYWQSLPADSVRIGYPSMGGFVLNLALEGTRLSGMARPVGDAGFGPREPHAVRLDRARCPGEDPAP